MLRRPLLNLILVFTKKSDDMTRIEGNIVDVVNRKIYPGVINVEGGVIQSIEEK